MVNTHSESDVKGLHDKSVRERKTGNYVGGLVGRVKSGEIINSTFSGKVQATGEDFGDLVGAYKR